MAAAMKTVETNPNPLGPIKAVRSRDLLADALREQILSGARPSGVALPSERELTEETGLSRAAVRDALRVLESEGLIETRQGRYGGSVVKLPANDALARPVALFARARGISLQEMIEARVAIEPTIAELAALRRTPEDLQALIQATDLLQEALPHVEQFLDLNVRWYFALADACHNDLLRAFIVSIAGLILAATSREGQTPEPTRRLILQSHRRVVEAVIAGDAPAARRRMERHVAGYQEHYERLGLTPSA
ncbi:FCD domain protein [Bordetella bronchiseptica GA96-01]|nr:FCD domain protein [Bordetella bronchiseptica OSU054]KAK65825.1 FCD domain protein [Bordetella bronchiseptica MO211]KCV32353.1 FCD domain protein [Bordetella bronchiseptica 00-P-2730]KCV40296.1 FCD domain protein [Bordetella bronchiseptica 345]KCV54039.1 FCD domain protein [Bordetella bronchiseptica 7E71]KDC40020.1 FCD domain protein [Bordetella bronchiseptica GA96-01]KDD45957.1 FCD domain protein [Bordetella bronchiseptica OSU095]